MRARKLFPYGVLAAGVAVMALTGLVVTTPAAAQEAAASASSPETPLGDDWNVKQLGEIHIEKIPALHVVTRTIQGGYDRTNEAFVDLKMAMLRQMNKQGLKLAKKSYSRFADQLPASPGSLISTSSYYGSACLATYPSDPDAVSAAAEENGTAPAIEWTAAIPVPESFKAPAVGKPLSVPGGPYEVSDLPATLAATMFSTVGRAPVDGLKFFRWMADNGYVQVAPTRMVYYQRRTGTGVGAAEMLNASQALINTEETKIIVPIKKRGSGISVKPASETVQPPADGHQRR